MHYLTTNQTMIDSGKSRRLIHIQSEIVSDLKDDEYPEATAGYGSTRRGLQKRRTPVICTPRKEELAIMSQKW